MACKGKARRSVYLTECVSTWGSASARGRRAEMQDAFAAVPRFSDVPVRMLAGAVEMEALGREAGLDAAAAVRLPAHLFGVYDGHGGSEVATYCSDRIHVAVTEELSMASKSGDPDAGIKEQWEKVLGDCFQKVDDEVSGKASRFVFNNNKEQLQCKPVADGDVGSTAVVAVVCASHVIIANCGDSRAVLCRGKEPLVMSKDHKPDRKDECARIEAAGGKVVYWDKVHRVSGILAVSRSIGDSYAKPFVIPKPEVIVVPRTKDDDCLILASDGMWDVMTNEQACRAARLQILRWYKRNHAADLDDDDDGQGQGGGAVHPAAQSAADHLVKSALSLGSTDNITVTVIDLKPRWRRIKQVKY